MNKNRKLIEFWTKYRVPFVYDDTLSLYQLVLKVIKHLNLMIEDQNELKKAIKEFLLAFDEDLSDTVELILKEWKDDGSLKEIINEALFESKLDKNIFDDFKNETEKNINKKLDETTFNTHLNNQNKIDNKQNLRLDNLEDQLNNQYLLIGDSYLNGRSGSTNVEGWGYHFNKFMGLTDKVDSHKLAENSSGFVRAGQFGNTFLSLLKGFKGDKDKITHIIVGGGHNDRVSDYAGVKTAVNTFMDYASKNFKNADIYLSFMAGNVRPDETNAGYRRKLFKEILPAYQVFNKNCYNIDSWIVLKDPRNLSDDGYHPNVRGYENIGKYLADSIKGVPSYNTQFNTNNVKLLNGNGNFTFYTVFNDKIIDINVQSIGYDVTDNKMITQIDGYKYYNFLGGFAGEESGSNFPVIFLKMNVRGDDGIFRMGIDGHLRFDNNNKLQLGLPSDITPERIVILRQTLTFNAANFYFNSLEW